MAARWGGPVAPAEDFATDGADLVIDALYGAGLSRDVDGLAARCVECDQRLRRGWRQGAGGRCSLRARRRDGGRARRRRRRDRDDRLLPPEAGPSSVLGRRADGAARLRRHRHSRRRARRDRAAGFRQSAEGLARGVAPADGAIAQIRARIGARAVRGGPSHRRGAAGGAGGLARRGRARHALRARRTPSPSTRPTRPP